METYYTSHSDPFARVRSHCKGPYSAAHIGHFPSRRTNRHQALSLLCVASQVRPIDVPFRLLVRVEWRRDAPRQCRLHPLFRLRFVGRSLRRYEK